MSCASPLSMALIYTSLITSGKAKPPAPHTTGAAGIPAPSVPATTVPPAAKQPAPIQGKSFTNVTALDIISLLKDCS